MDTEKYGTLGKLLFKLLCHGFPENPKIHSYITQNIKEDGFIKLDIILNIINLNQVILTPIATKIYDDKYHKISEDDILHTIQIPYYLNKIEILSHINKFIRAKYNHTIDKIKPEMIAQEILTREMILNGLLVFKKININELDEYLKNGIHSNARKCIVLETQYTQNHYQDLDNENEIWKTVYIDIISLMDRGMKFYILDDKILCVNGSAELFLPPEYLHVK